MPTSSESRIQPTSSYNLRSKPLPRTGTATSRANKENTGANIKTASTASHRTRNTAKSKIPVPRSSKASSASSHALKPSNAATPTKGTRKVPDFEKLHKSWTKKFQTGKAVAKKPCTQVRAFDLTRPGTRFKPAYYDPCTDKGRPVGQKEDTSDGDDDDFEVDDQALNSILHGGGLQDTGRPEGWGRATLAGTGVTSGSSRQLGGGRQTLGTLPRRGAGRTNNASNISSNNDFRTAGRQTRKSLVDQQKDVAIQFESDASALASILNNTGVIHAVKSSVAAGRQTIASTSARSLGNHRSSIRAKPGTGRTSIYYQKPKDHDINRVYSEFAKKTLSRLTIGDASASVDPALIESLLPNNRGSFYVPNNNSQKGVPFQQSDSGTKSTDAHLTAKNWSKNTPGRLLSNLNSCLSAGKRTATASRVPNPHYQALQSRQELSCSPALREAKHPITPAQRILTTPRAQSNKAVRWADVLTSPEQDGVHALATKDVVTVLNFGDDENQDVLSQTRNQIDEVEKLEAETAANRQKLTEMEEIERQLELEIARLHEAEAAEQLAVEQEPVKLPKEENIQNGVHVMPSHPFEGTRPLQQQRPDSVAEMRSLDSVPGNGNKITVPASMGLSGVGHSHQAINENEPVRGNEQRQDCSVPISCNGGSSAVSSGFIHQGNVHQSPFQVVRPSAMPSSEKQSRRPDATGIQRPFLNSAPGISLVDHKTRDSMVPHSVNDGSHTALRALWPDASQTNLGDHRSDPAFESNPKTPAAMNNGVLDQFESANSLLANMDLTESTEFYQGLFHHPVCQNKTSVVVTTATSHYSGTASSARKADIPGMSARVQGEPHLAWPENNWGKVGSLSQGGSTGGDRWAHSVTELDYLADPARKQASRLYSGRPGTSLQPHYTTVNSTGQSRMSTLVHSSQQIDRTASPNLQLEQKLLHSSISQVGNSITDDSTRTDNGLQLGNTDQSSADTWEPINSNKLTSRSQPMSAKSTCLQTPQPRKGRSVIHNRLLSQATPVPPLLLASSSTCDISPPIHTPFAMRNIVTANSAKLRRDGHGSSPLLSPEPLNPARYNKSVAQAQIPHVPINGNYHATLPVHHSQPISSNIPAGGQHPRLVQQIPVQLSAGFLSQPTTHVTETGHLGQPFGLLSTSGDSTRDAAKSQSDPLSLCNQQAFTAGAANSIVDPFNNEHLRNHIQTPDIQGSLSLSSSLGRTVPSQPPAANQGLPAMKETVSQMFHHVLLDEECALYACRLKGRFAPQSSVSRPLNPVAKVLLEGDEMHFVPLSNVEVLVASPIGSAFSNYLQNAER